MKIPIRNPKWQNKNNNKIPREKRTLKRNLWGKGRVNNVKFYQFLIEMLISLQYHCLSIVGWKIHSPSLHLLPYPRHWKRTQQHYGCCTKKQNIRVNVKVVKPGNSKDIFEYYFILTCTSNKTVIHRSTHIHHIYILLNLPPPTTTSTTKIIWFLCFSSVSTEKMQLLLTHSLSECVIWEFSSIQSTWTFVDTV